MEVRVGDIIRVVEIDNASEWWGGHLYDDSAQNTGWFPGCIVKRLSAAEEQHLIEKKRRQEEGSQQHSRTYKQHYGSSGARDAHGSARRDHLQASRDTGIADGTSSYHGDELHGSGSSPTYRDRRHEPERQHNASRRITGGDRSSDHSSYHPSRGSTSRRYEYEPTGEYATSGGGTYSKSTRAAGGGHQNSSRTTANRTRTDPSGRSAVGATSRQRLSNTGSSSHYGGPGGLDGLARDEMGTGGPLSGETEHATPSKPRSSNPYNVKLPSPGRSETVKKLEAENKKIKEELRQRLAQIQSIKSDLDEREQQDARKRKNLAEFISGRFNEKLDERQIRGIEDGGFDPESLPPRFDEVKNMFANKTKDHPLQAEVVRLQKKLSEVQAQQRQCQQVLDTDEDLASMFGRLRTLFNMRQKDAPTGSGRRITGGSFNTRNRTSMISVPASPGYRDGTEGSFYDDENDPPLGEVKPNLPPPARDVVNKEDTPGKISSPPPREDGPSPRKQLTGNVKARISMFERPGVLDDTMSSVQRSSLSYR